MTLPVGHRAAVTDAYQRILDSIAPNASRLKASYNGHLARALAVAVGVHLLGIGAYWLAAGSVETAVVQNAPPEQIRVRELTPPAPRVAPPTTPPGGRPPTRAVGAGVVVPTPDERADPDVVVARQEDLSESGLGPAGPEPNNGTGDGPTGATPPEPYVPPVGRTAPPIPAEPVERPAEPEPTNPVLEFSEFPPSLIGGIEGLQAGIEYPSFDRSAGIQGRVVVQFVVDEAGVPSQIVVARSVSPGLDAAAVEAVGRARFVPGRQNGRTVKVRFTLPVTFRLR